MKWILILVLFLISGCVTEKKTLDEVAEAQAVGAVRTIPQHHQWQRLFNGTLGANGDGFDTTSAFSAKQWAGVLTLVIETDTTGASVASANQSDSCLTVFMQLKRKYTDPDDQSVDEDWMSFYNSTDLVKVRLDSLSRDRVNAAGNTFYLNPAVLLNANGEWAYADSVRFILGIGVGDSLSTKMDVGGQ